MKKTITLLLILILLFPLVLSQENESNKSKFPKLPDIPTNITKEEIKEKAKEKIKDPTPKLDEKLDKEIKIPGLIKAIARYTIGVKDPISISKLMITLMIWFFFVILFSIFGGTFQEGPIKWAIAIVLTTIIAFTGVFNTAATLLLNIGESFKFLEETSSGTLLFWIIIIAAVLIITSKITKKFKESKDISEAETAGREVGTSLGFLKSMRSWFKWTRKIQK